MTLIRSSNRISDTLHVALQMKDIAPTSKRAGAVEAQAHDAVLPGFADRQNALAVTTGLALLLVEGHQPPALTVSNNNSICRAFQSSPEHAHLCEPFCGIAYERAQESITGAHYRCHAGLHCVAVPVEIKGRKLAVIGGRAFLKSADYRALGERIRAGDLQNLLSNDLFKNVIFAAPEDLQTLHLRISQLAADYNRSASFETTPAQIPETIEQSIVTNERDFARAPVADTREVFADEHSASDLSLAGVCRALAKVLGEKYDLKSFALLVGNKNGFSTALVAGRFQKQAYHLEFIGEDALFMEAATAERSLPVYETTRAGG